MPPWELKAIEYIVGAVLLGLALVVSTDPDDLCHPRLGPPRLIFHVVKADMTVDRGGFDVCLNDNLEWGHAPDRP